MMRRRRHIESDRPRIVDDRNIEDRPRIVDDREVIEDSRFERVTPESTHESVESYSEARDWWSPAQVVSLIIGLGFLVVGAIGLARAGLSGLYTHTAVAGIHETQLLSIIHIVFGAFLVMAGAVRGGARGLMTLMGAIAVAFGIVLLVQPTSLHGYLGTHQAHGFLYLITGLICIMAGVFFPSLAGDRTVESRRTHRF